MALEQLLKLLTNGGVSNVINFLATLVNALIVRFDDIDHLNNVETTNLKEMISRLEDRANAALAGSVAKLTDEIHSHRMETAKQIDLLAAAVEAQAKTRAAGNAP